MVIKTNLPAEAKRLFGERGASVSTSRLVTDSAITNFFAMRLRRTYTGKLVDRTNSIVAGVRIGLTSTAYETVLEPLQSSPLNIF